MDNIDHSSSEDLRGGSGVEVLFPFRIPVFRYRTGDPELNEQLRATILERYERSEGLQNSNRGGGWQSHHNLQEWSGPGIDRLVQTIGDFARQMVSCTVEEPQPSHYENWLVEAWGNVNVQGARNASHDHFTESRGTLWSGVYYVDPGQTSGREGAGGRTIFEDRVGVPRRRSDGGSFAQEFTVDPKPGLMIAFPATLRHRVEPYLGGDLRITIAWNLYNPEFRIPKYDDDKTQEVWESKTIWHVSEILKAAKIVISHPIRLLGMMGLRSTRSIESSKEDLTLSEYLNEQEERNVSTLRVNKKEKEA